MFWTMLLLALPYLAHAAPGEDYARRLKDTGRYLCTDTAEGAGIFCSSKDKTTYVVIPKALTQHRRNLFYAHGLTGVCKPGISGENYLRDFVPFFAKFGIVAFLPFRSNAKDLGFPLDNFVKRVEQEIGSGDVPWAMAGHSFGGQFLATTLSKSTVAGRVDKVLLLDAAYNIETVRGLWRSTVTKNPRMKLKLISSTTAAKGRELVSYLQETAEGRVSQQVVNDPHCYIPRQLEQL